MVLKNIFIYLMAPDVKKPTDVVMSVCVHVFVLQLEQFNYQKTVTSRSARSGSHTYQEPSPEPAKKGISSISVGVGGRESSKWGQGACKRLCQIKWVTFSTLLFCLCVHPSAAQSWMHWWWMPLSGVTISEHCLGPVLEHEYRKKEEGGSTLVPLSSGGFDVNLKSRSVS